MTDVISFFNEHAGWLAAAVGVVAGLVGSLANWAKVWDEWLCGVLAAVIGAYAYTLIGYGIGDAVAEPSLMGWFLFIFAAGGIVGMPITRGLDAANHVVTSILSLFLFKWIMTPVLTTLGLLATIGFAIAKKATLRRGTFFLNIGGTSSGAVTLGAVIYTKGGNFTDGKLKDDLAQHEAYHTRQATAFGELGFYLGYILIGLPWGAAQGGRAWSTNQHGCGNPYEKTARTHNHSAKPSPAHKCSGGGSSS